MNVKKAEPEEDENYSKNKNNATKRVSIVDFSIRYQNCVANFCKTGNPSTEDIKWEKYDKENKYCTLLNSDKMECIKNFRADRIDNMIKMVDENDAMKFFCLGILCLN